MEKLGHNTIKYYLATIRHLYIAEGMGDPEISGMARFKQVLKGIKAVQAKTQVKTRPCLPTSIELLGKLRSVWQRQDSLDA